MKKIFIITAVIATLVSCSTPARLITTSTSTDATATFKTTTVVADIQVEGRKISFLYIPSSTVEAGGYENIIKTAVHEALMSVGKHYDVLIAKETQVKYTSGGKIESILVTGYPGKYVNWRSSDEIADLQPSISFSHCTSKKFNNKNK